MLDDEYCQACEVTHLLFWCRLNAGGGCNLRIHELANPVWFSQLHTVWKKSREKWHLDEEKKRVC